MKIVHLSLEDSFGAGRAALRINRAVNKAGVDSAVYVLNKSEMADSYAINLSRAERLKNMVYDRMNHMLLNKYEEHGYFHVDRYGIDFMKNPVVAEADILHFHWINEGIWSRKFVKSLIKTQKPIVWTMHDMWTFTGGCHYDEFCGNYKKQCVNCKVLGNGQNCKDALKAQKRKKEYLEKLNIQLVGCSQWITEQANESTIGKSIKRKAVCVPNPTNDECFKIYDKDLCRQLLGIKSEKKLVLFGAVNAVSDQRKGAHYIIEALKTLDPEKYILGVFGSKTVNLGLDAFEVNNFGRINDDFHLSFIYNAADVFVAPSMQENLANTVMESLTCGTAVTAFSIGGMPDMIIHEQNGYLAEAFDVQDLARGIQAAAELSKNPQKIRNTILERFSEKKIGQLYSQLYGEVLK